MRHIPQLRSIAAALAVLIALSFGALPFGALPSLAADVEGAALQRVHENITRQYPAVRQLSADAFAKLQSTASAPLLVLDVREADEHAVSHIPGAVRVPPGLSPAEFRRRFAGQLAGRTIVLYCSVGARSSDLAKAITSAGATSNAAAVYNLAGGIFNWHNQKRPLSTRSGATDLVHPYSWRWSRLVERRDQTSYRPSKATE